MRGPLGNNTEEFIVLAFQATIAALAQGPLQKQETHFQEVSRRLAQAMKDGNIRLFVELARKSEGESKSFPLMLNRVLGEGIKDGHVDSFVRILAALSGDVIIELIHPARISEAVAKFFSEKKPGIFQLEHVVGKLRNPAARALFSGAYGNTYERYMEAAKKARMESGELRLASFNRKPQPGHDRPNMQRPQPRVVFSCARPVVH